MNDDIDPAVARLREAITNLAYAVEARAGVSGYLDVTDMHGFDSIRTRVLEMRDAQAELHRAVTIKTRDHAPDPESAPVDPAIATEPDCCS